MTRKLTGLGTANPGPLENWHSKVDRPGWRLGGQKVNSFGTANLGPSEHSHSEAERPEAVGCVARKLTGLVLQTPVP